MVIDQPWSVDRPYWVPKMNLKIFEPLSGCVFYFKILHAVVPLFWSLWNSTKAQGTLMDLHGPPNGPYEANFRGPLVKKGPAESLHSPKCS